jgi:hypothetical protein
MPRPKAYVTPSRQGTATITEVEVGSPANVLLRLRESTSAADLSKLDKFGLEPELSRRVASFADDFNAGHAEDSLVRSLLLRYVAAASQVCANGASTAEQRRDAMLRIADLLKHDKRMMKAFLELLPPASRVVTPRSSEESAFATI